MKKILTVSLLAISCFCFSQKLYKRIDPKNINKERLNIARSFAQDYLDKCEKKDYSKFEKYIIGTRATQKLNDSIQQNCEKSHAIYGKSEILNLNSSYYSKYHKGSDPLELFIFDFKTEKIPEVKYASVWVYEDKNIIGGLWFSREKPLTRKSIKKK